MREALFLNCHSNEKVFKLNNKTAYTVTFSLKSFNDFW